MDVHCLLAGKYAVAHETSAPGEARFHLVLAGKCRVRSVTGWTDLNAGDFLLLPHGDAHDVLPPRSVQSKTSRPVHRLRLSQDSTLPIKGNVRSPSNADLDLLCGRFICAYGAGSMLLRALPPRVHVNLQDMASGELLGSLIALLQREATLAQAGALAVVNALGQAILTFALRHHGVDESAPPGLLTIMADRLVGQRGAARLVTRLDNSFTRRKSVHVPSDLRAPVPRESRHGSRRILIDRSHDARMRSDPAYGSRSCRDRPSGGLRFGSSIRQGVSEDRRRDAR